MGYGRAIRTRAQKWVSSRATPRPNAIKVGARRRGRHSLVFFFFFFSFFSPSFVLLFLGSILFFVFFFENCGGACLRR